MDQPVIKFFHETVAQYCYNLSMYLDGRVEATRWNDLADTFVGCHRKMTGEQVATLVSRTAAAMRGLRQEYQIDADTWWASTTSIELNDHGNVSSVRYENAAPRPALSAIETELFQLCFEETDSNTTSN